MCLSCHCDMKHQSFDWCSRAIAHMNGAERACMMILCQKMEKENRFNCHIMQVEGIWCREKQIWNRVLRITSELIKASKLLSNMNLVTD